ncbi:MAG: hypothetical protein ACRC7V_00545 [Lachnospiraceae bacterium]
MKKIYEVSYIQSYIKKSCFQDVLEQLEIPIFLMKYEKNEFVSSPFCEEEFFQIVVSGSLIIYFIRDDGTRYSLSRGNNDYILGDTDFFYSQNINTFAQACEELICIAFSIKENKETLLQNNLFLQLIGKSLSQKLMSITNLDASPSSLRERVLTYMKYKCDSGLLKGLEQAAFHLHCSSRQLQRIMKQCEAEGFVEKIGKGTYQLTSHDIFL